jgi:hypothetical protein
MTPGPSEEERGRPFALVNQRRGSGARPFPATSRIGAAMIPQILSLLALICGTGAAGELQTANDPRPDQTPLIGLPLPDFGIEQSHLRYKEETYDFGGKAERYRDAGSGPYTHYIDNTAAAATDIDNPYGTPARPRLTIPLNLTAGSVVELRGGPYTYETKRYYGAAILGTGTAEKPIFVRGGMAGRKVQWRSSLTVRGSYIIIENLLFEGPRNSGVKIWNPSDHITVRTNEARGHTEGGPIFALNPKSSSNSKTDFNRDILFYKNYLHDNGYPCLEATRLGNGFQIQGNSRRVWIIENVIVDGAEDGIHIIHYKNSNYPPDSIFIYRNIISRHTENAIDVKRSRNIVIAHNVFSGFDPYSIPPSDGSDGSAICLNNEGPAGTVAENHYILFNTFYDCAIGVRAEYSGCIYGNRFYDIDSCAISFRHVPRMLIINNTFSNVHSGILNNGAGAAFSILNNIICIGPAANGFHICYNSANSGEIRNNLFWGPQAKAILRTGRRSWRTGLASWPPALSGGSLEADPAFISTALNDSAFLQPSAGSPARSKGLYNGSLTPLLEDFRGAFNADLSIDIRSVSRPVKRAWTLGAFE